MMLVFQGLFSLLGFLIEKFYPFKFIVITDRKRLTIAILFIVFCLFCCSFIPLFLSCCLLFFLRFLFFLLQLIYNILSISAVQKSDPVTHTHTHTHTQFSHIIFCHITSDQIFLLVLCSRISLFIYSPSPWQQVCSPSP